MELFGRRFDTGEPIRLELAQGRIARATPAAVAADEAARWPWIAPGLLDIQVNGHGGQEFSSPDLTVEKVARIAEALAAGGVTRFCPTVTTAESGVLRHAMRMLSAACDSEPWLARRIPGVHLEGPYITREDGARGAHPREHCRAPDWDEFQRLQEAAGGRIRILTLSPEYDGSAEFVGRVARSGVVAAIGHTVANSEQIRRAVEAGARLSTHLGNGSQPLIRRHPNYIWDQLADDRLVASLIVDGHHLPPAVVKSFVRVKSPRRCILVSDMSGMAGLAPGRYPSRLCELEILPEGKLVVAGQREILAGAGLPLSVGVPNVMHFAGVDLATAIRMAVDHPAELLALPAGGLAPGDPADLVEFDLAPPADGTGPARLVVRATVIDGQCVAGSPIVSSPSGRGLG